MEFSELGRAVRQCWRNIPTFYPEVKLIAFQMMPDHLHGILQITNETSNHLGKIINGFKTGCNKEYRKLFAEALPLHTLSHNNLKIVKNHQETEENGYAYEERFFNRTINPDHPGNQQKVSFLSWVTTTLSAKATTCFRG